jgi:hypothetical protein
MIYRTVKDRDHHYVRLNTTALDDDRLSFKAVAIHAYIMSKPDGWEARESDMVQRHTDGLASVRSGIKELIDCGYMVRIRVVNDQKQVVSWRIDTYETPDLNPHYKPGEPIPMHVDEPDCENLNLGSTGETEPDCENPQMEKPKVENRNGSNNRVLVRIDCSNDPPTETDAYASAQDTPAPDSPVSLASQFRNFHDELKTTRNRAAVLRRAYVYCYGEDDAPDYGRIGAFAKRVGGAGMALELLWSQISRPPNGNVLDYLEVTHAAKHNDRGNKRYQRKPEQAAATPEERRSRYLPDQFVDIIEG